MIFYIITIIALIILSVMCIYAAYEKGFEAGLSNLLHKMITEELIKAIKKGDENDRT